MINRIFSFFKLYKEAFFWGSLSGVLIGTSWIPFPPWALFFSFVPMWFFVLQNGRSWREILLAGWTTQFVLTLIGFHWVAYVSHEFGFMPWPAAILMLLIFAAGMHVYIALSAFVGEALGRKLKLKNGATLLVLATLTALFEQYWPSIFSWNMGYPLLWSQSSLVQWADVIGFSGLSYAVLLVNAWVVWLFLHKNLKLAGATTLAISLLLGTLHFFALQKKEFWRKTDSVLKALVVQANIGNSEKIFAEQGRGFQQFIVDEFFKLTKEAVEKHPEADLVLWPESAFPDILDSFAESRTYPTQFKTFSQSIQKPILTGAYSKDPPGKPFRDDYNGVFLFDEKSTLVGEPYHKTQLLIFGEYIPFGREFPILAKLNPGGIGWGRGQGPMTWSLAQATLGPQICYESLDPQFSASLAKKGADILVNVTNDSWFGPRFEPEQHGTMTLARGLETRRPMIRSTNTGISSVILADGTILEKSPVYQKWFGLYDVKFQKNAPQTFYSRFGAWLPLVLFVFMLAVLALGRKRD
jgi:apolipoprotein N-acyltransferase